MVCVLEWRVLFFKRSTCYLARSDDRAFDITLTRSISFWIIDDCSFSEYACNIITTFMASFTPTLSNLQSFTLVLNLVIQWLWVSWLSIGLVQKNVNLSAIKFFFRREMCC